MEEKKQQELTPEEEKELRDGGSLYEMTQTAGWQKVRQMLEDRAYHSWVDPRNTTSEKEWVWQELNLFHSADAAKQLLEDIEKAISRADYLAKVKSGEIERKTMRF